MKKLYINKMNEDQKIKLLDINNRFYEYIDGYLHEGYANKIFNLFYNLRDFNLYYTYDSGFKLEYCNTFDYANIKKMIVYLDNLNDYYKFTKTDHFIVMDDILQCYKTLIKYIQYYYNIDIRDAIMDALGVLLDNLNSGIDDQIPLPAFGDVYNELNNYENEYILIDKNNTSDFIVHYDYNQDISIEDQKKELQACRDYSKNILPLQKNISL